jgi:hypothetical protein
MNSIKILMAMMMKKRLQTLRLFLCGGTLFDKIFHITLPFATYNVESSKAVE